MPREILISKFFFLKKNLISKHVPSAWVAFESLTVKQLGELEIWKFSEEKKPFAIFIALSFSSDPIQSMAKFRSCNLLFIFSLSIFLLLRRASSSYAGSASSIVNPAKVKQISWSPRYLISLHSARSLLLF